MKRTGLLWIALVLCFALVNSSRIGVTLAGTEPVRDPISGLPPGSGTLAPSGDSAATAPAPWTKYAGNPVLDAGSPDDWDSEGVSQPSVLARDGTYKLWYSGYGGPQSLDQIGLATSPNGVNWTKSLHNPVLAVGPPGAWDSGYVNAPHVILHDGVYKMWYRGTGDASYSAGASIGYATSTDGENWARHPGNPVLTTGSAGTWDSLMLWSVYVIAEGSTYRMWYSAYNGPSFRIGYATSSNGVDWTKYGGNPVLDVGPAGSWDDLFVYYPNVLFNGSTYEMWYSALSSGGAFAIGYATSPDGVNWTKYAGNPVLTTGSAGSWDSTVVLGSPVVPQVGSYQMWYMGRDALETGRIGYATSSRPVQRVYLPIVLR